MEPLSIDPTSSEPPFAQLRAAIASRAASGRLEAGEKLPTVRALAADVGLAVNTVARVYRELEADGVVVTEGRRGTFVASPSGSAVADVGAEAARYAAAARRAGLSRSEAGRLLDDAW
ncbi:HTH-type transcriptional repressor YtrA [Nocardioides aquaticus]|uniref:HTH-type transcriptional repressor YtrA n=1 Tax=Nocardioides aquaticus TaxID=160826 RepID=A0ABX8EE14_9ACTN|nr:GntR family transcriptional regulator [Nocardioides aquaticus]QVT78690.1 HTH-type transcriptional repressor YtrA [Nocardioides aquaticus]